MPRLRHILVFCLLSLSTAVVVPAAAAEYAGRVVDNHGAPVSYATVYMADNPVIGTATAANGTFRLETDLPYRR